MPNTILLPGKASNCVVERKICSLSKVEKIYMLNTLFYEYVNSHDKGLVKFLILNIEPDSFWSSLMALVFKFNVNSGATPDRKLLVDRPRKAIESKFTDDDIVLLMKNKPHFKKYLVKVISHV